MRGALERPDDEETEDSVGLTVRSKCRRCGSLLVEHFYGSPEGTYLHDSVVSLALAESTLAVGLVPRGRDATLDLPRYGPSPSRVTHPDPREAPAIYRDGTPHGIRIFPKKGRRDFDAVLYCAGCNAGHVAHAESTIV